MRYFFMFKILMCENWLDAFAYILYKNSFSLQLVSSYIHNIHSQCNHSSTNALLGDLSLTKGVVGGREVTNVTITVRNLVTNLSSFKLKIKYPLDWQISIAIFTPQKNILANIVLRRYLLWALFFLCKSLDCEFLKGILANIFVYSCKNSFGRLSI